VDLPCHCRYVIPVRSFAALGTKLTPAPVSILVVIAVIVVVYIMVNRAASGAKKRSILASRSVIEDLQMNTARSVDFAGERPVSRIFSQSKIVVPNVAFDPKNLPEGAAGSLQKRGSLPQVPNVAFDQNRLPAGSQGSLQKREALSAKLDIENVAFDQNRIPPGSQGSLQRRGPLGKRFVIPDDLRDE
jgi:hypothetical protein